MVYITSEEDMANYFELARMMVGEGPKTKRQFRAFCPGASPPDNSCSPANKGAGSLVSKAMEPHKEKLAAVRSKIVSETIAARTAWIEAKKRVGAAMKEVYPVAARLNDIQARIGELDEKIEEQPDDNRLKAMREEASREYEAELKAWSALDKKVVAAGEESERLWKEMRATTRRVMREESDAVNAEDGVEVVAGVTRNRQTVSEILDARSNIRLTDPSKSPRLDNTLRSANAFIADAVNPEIHGMAMTATTYVRNEPMRAFASVDSDDVKFLRVGEMKPELRRSYTEIGIDAAAVTHVHEMAHHMEFSTPEVNELTQDFLRSRTGHEQPVRFNVKFPNSSYRDDEVGSPDDFAKAVSAVNLSDMDSEDTSRTAHYAGKRYGRGSTEVLSIGMELLHNDAAAFAEADPEWFDLVTGVASGRLLTKSRERKKAGKRYAD